MNSTITGAAKVAEELIITEQRHKEGILHTKVRLEESFKKNWKAK